MTVNDVHQSQLQHHLNYIQTSFIKHVTIYIICVTEHHNSHYKSAEICNLLLFMI